MMKWLDYKGLNHFLNKLKQLFIIKPKVGNDGDFLVKKGNLSEWKSIPNLLTFKGIVATYADLPTAANATVGDVWAVADQSNAEYFCTIDNNVKYWEPLGVSLNQYTPGEGIGISGQTISVKHTGAIGVSSNSEILVDRSKVLSGSSNISVTLPQAGNEGTDPVIIQALGYSWDATKKSFAEGDCDLPTNYHGHCEGWGTTAQNECEHAEGRYNVSHTGATENLQTIHSIGIGNNVLSKQNAVAVMANGDVYIKGLGSYNGTAIGPSVSRLQDLIKQSDWTQSSSTAIDYIKNKPALAAVATSGSYTDLINVPTNLSKSYLHTTTDTPPAQGVFAIIIPESTHGCGTDPIVQVRVDDHVVQPDIEIQASGQIAVRFTGLTTVSHEFKIKIIG